MGFASEAPARTLLTGVVMRREPVAGPMARWQPWRWVLADVVVLQGPPGVACVQWPSEVPAGPLALEPASGAASPDVHHWGFPGFPVVLHPEDAEGLYLNLTSPQPCFWVMWREGESEDELPAPQIVTLSYHDAGRWLDAQERVDQVPAPADVVRWMAAFVEHHYRPEPKRRARPASFQPLTDRFGQPARISTGERRRGPAGDSTGDGA
ncbi:DUF3305 domain-containing protein [Tepidimonas taiwanensis]|uniref:DUF3305 domain-containing protein n=2 Tax=Betaproteobacteria TaxID=28216 RepID=A0A554X5U4_9BURK|nr:DUF3305 domain-containing protein [Tepidimonas taiwanensis]MCX7692647.1 DUF3305 domain-containing protein [Tepidimonas taiwanensis]MDM7462886.1 DUF3305 domain-containing protein [Tepidimonas taiwanensis]TSE31195.1 hypothetical protein Ttaiw_01572 [Tepidimonas taiwanensis]UBQ04696.1 DUF3305 domain-containing protein [Tepidimonas taiwanensis]